MKDGDEGEGDGKVSPSLPRLLFAVSWGVAAFDVSETGRCFEYIYIKLDRNKCITIPSIPSASTLLRLLWTLPCT